MRTLSHNQLNSSYKEWFKKNAAGEYFCNELNKLRDRLLTDAEDTPENARDYANQAKGVRLVLDHMESVMTTSKKVAGRKGGGDA